MATEKQIEANRRNAALSTGPKTDEGKAQSRANAMTHSLRGSLESKGLWENFVWFGDNRT